MANRTLDAAAQRCSDPEAFMSRAAYAHGIVDAADKAAEVAHLQARYDLPYRMWYRSPAPPISPDESLASYQRRLPQGLVRFSDQLPGMDFKRVDDRSLPSLAKMLVDNVTERFQRPEGAERSYTTRDHANREVTHFCVDAAAAWQPFTFGDKRGRIVTKREVNLDSAVPVTRYGRTVAAPGECW